MIPINEKNYWITKDGRKILIEDLTDSHLINILRMLKRNNNLDYHPSLQEEAKERNLKWESFHFITCWNNFIFKIKSNFWR